MRNQTLPKCPITDLDTRPTGSQFIDYKWPFELTAGTLTAPGVGGQQVSACTFTHKGLTLGWLKMLRSIIRSPFVSLAYVWDCVIKLVVPYVGGSNNWDRPFPMSRGRKSRIRVKASCVAAPLPSWSVPRATERGFPRTIQTSTCRGFLLHKPSFVRQTKVNQARQYPQMITEQHIYLWDFIYGAQVPLNRSHINPQWKVLSLHTHSMTTIPSASKNGVGTETSQYCLHKLKISMSEIWP